MFASLAKFKVLADFKNNFATLKFAKAGEVRF